MSVESRKLYEEYLLARIGPRCAHAEISTEVQPKWNRFSVNECGSSTNSDTSHATGTTRCVGIADPFGSHELHLCFGGANCNNKELGSTYIRWGHNRCPTNSTIVYEGYVAGKKHNINGGGSNFLCLTKQPEYTNLQSPNIAKNLYGVETDINGFSPSIADKDVTCAVCLTQKSSVLMVPGTKSCPSGWDMEYWGYLMSHGVGGTWQPTQYICIDSRPVAVPGGDRDNGESVVYLVGGVCGSLKCPPYVNGKPLTCVVCSR